MRPVFVLSAARTPIGKFGGSFASMTVPDLGEVAAKAAIERSGLPAAAIDVEVRELAGKIAANAPLTVRATKEMTRRLMALRRVGSDDAKDLIEMCYGSADFQEGVAAFLDKRPPRWTGR